MRARGDYPELGRIANGWAVIDRRRLAGRPVTEGTDTDG